MRKPKYTCPLPTEIEFTKEGYENLKKEKEELLIKRKRVIDEVVRARELGDLSENGLYKAAKAEQRSIDGRLIRIEYLLKMGRIVHHTSSDTVQIGSTVVVNDGQSERTFHIVGGYESDPLQGKISHHSPIGSRLIGKRVGEKVTITTPKGEINYLIKSLT